MIKVKSILDDHDERLNFCLRLRQYAGNYRKGKCPRQTNTNKWGDGFTRATMLDRLPLNTNT